MKAPSTVILFYKPFGVLSQFTSKEGRPCLKDFGPFPPDVYPAGRLDADSEGLLVLTDDAEIAHSLTDPRFHHPKSYAVQVEGVPEESALDRLRHGVLIKGTKTRPARVERLEQEPALPPRPVPIRYRKSVPTAWVVITITEGRNRQVRHMTAAVGHPTLRLVRIRIGQVGIGMLQPGEHRRLSAKEVELLRTA